MATIDIRTSMDSTYVTTAHSAIVDRIREVDMRIQTWKEIASRQGIDIEIEKESLYWLRKDFYRAIGHHSEEVTLLRQEILRKRFCRHIVQKVRGNFQRNIPEERETRLKEALADLIQNILLPWMERAKQENVDITEETEVIITATRNGMYTLDQNHMHAKTVVFLQQLNHVTLCSARIIRKVFVHQVERRAEQEKSKDWFDDAWVSTIEGITRDALALLPIQGNLETFEERCQRVFIGYLDNLKLLNDDPKTYNALADREWLRRSILLRSEELLRLVEGEPHLAHQIAETTRIALQTIESKEDTQRIEERVNDAFNLIFERVPNEKHRFR